MLVMKNAALLHFIIPYEMISFLRCCQITPMHSFKIMPHIAMLSVARVTEEEIVPFNKAFSTKCVH